MTTWARSDVYGSAVVLGPTQQAVYRFVLGATDHGRRPVFTLARIASVTGKPVSSVHEALGRLRALGLIGCAARMGRTGGHRLWRVAPRVSGALDAARHRLTIARVLKRWYAQVVRTTEGTGQGVRPTLWPDGTTGHPGGQASEGSPHASGGPSFRERMREAGFSPWWRLANNGTDEHESPSEDHISGDGSSRPGGHPVLGERST